MDNSNEPLDDFFSNVGIKKMKNNILWKNDTYLNSKRPIMLGPALIYFIKHAKIIINSYVDLMDNLPLIKNGYST